MTEKHKLEPAIIKSEQLVSEKLEIHIDLNELAPESVLWSCDSGQRIPCFDICQLTIIWMSIIKLSSGYWLHSRLRTS